MYTYWQHEKSGEIFAVRTGLDGLAIGVTGPITQAEATAENYGDFDCDPEDAEWANEQPMRLYEPIDEADDDMDAAFPEQAFIPR